MPTTCNNTLAIHFSPQNVMRCAQGCALCTVLVVVSLVPRRSLLLSCPREVWERAGERTTSISR